MKTSIATLFSIAICCSTAFALKCIKCNSEGLPKCHDGKGIQGEACRELTEEEKQLGAKWVCGKAVVDVAGRKVTDRACTRQFGQRSPCEEFAKGLANENQVQEKANLKECMTCDSDNCNGPPPQRGNGNKLAAWTPVLVAFVAVFLKFI